MGFCAPIRNRTDLFDNLLSQASELPCSYFLDTIGEYHSDLGCIGKWGLHGKPDEEFGLAWLDTRIKHITGHIAFTASRAFYHGGIDGA